MVVITFEEGWEKGLKVSFEKIIDFLDSDQTGESPLTNEVWMRNYNLCYQVSTGPNARLDEKRIYLSTGKLIENYLNRKASKIRQVKGASIFEAMGMQWRNYRVLTKWMRKSCLFLENNYIKLNSQRPDVMSILDRGQAQFKDNLFMGVEDVLAQTFNETVNKDRGGEMVRKDLLRDCKDLFIDMGMNSIIIYETYLETPLLSATRDYYRMKKTSWLPNKSTPEYVTSALRALDDEKKRVKDYLHISTCRKILSVVGEALITPVLQELSTNEATGCKNMLMNDKFGELKDIYNLFSKVENGLEPIINQFRLFLDQHLGYIRDKRAERLSGSKGKSFRGEDPDFVKETLNLMNKYDPVVKDCFDNSELFKKAVATCMSEAMSTDVKETPTPPVISAYFNHLVKNKDKLNESIQKTQIDGMIDLVHCFRDKLAFQDAYLRHLAKRLLDGKPHIEIEKRILSSFKVKYGTSFTSKMEVLINDYNVGKDINNQYKLQAPQNKKEIDFSIQLLSGGNWPIETDIKVEHWPPGFEKCMNSFNLFYGSRNKGRKVKFEVGQGTCTVTRVPGSIEKNKKKYIIQTTTLQGIVLQAFSGHANYISFSNLRDQFNLESDHLKFILESLTFSSTNLLEKKTSAGVKDRSISSTDEFRTNLSFKNQRTNFRLKPPVFRSRQRNKDYVADKKKLALESCIVRIMKSKKTLTLEALIGSIMDQTELLLFTPEKRFIKMRIEDLIEKEYMERGETPNVFNYLA